MRENAMLMIHNAMTGMWGNKHDFRREAEILEKIGQTVVQAVVTRSGKSEAEIRTMIEDTETWLTAKEAVGIGLADIVMENHGYIPDQLNADGREVELIAIE